MEGFVSLGLFVLIIGSFVVGALGWGLTQMIGNKNSILAKIFNVGGKFFMGFSLFVLLLTLFYYYFHIPQQERNYEKKLAGKYRSDTVAYQGIKWDSLNFSTYRLELKSDNSFYLAPTPNVPFSGSGNWHYNSEGGFIDLQFGNEIDRLFCHLNDYGDSIQILLNPELDSQRKVYLLKVKNIDL